MKIVVENKIPYISEAIKLLTDDVSYLSASEFNSSSIKDADVLIIRTRVTCNRALLEGTNVKLIATATIGYDHIDTAYCAEHGIVWKNAPGCNSNSVRQYIESSLFLLERDYCLDLSSLTIGVIGVGNVGSKIATLAQSLGMRVLLNDPIKAAVDTSFQHTPYEAILEEADIITYHVPLTRDGKFPTYHLFNSAVAARCKKNPFIINTSRGEVVDSLALIDALSTNRVRQAIIDVWESEPNLNLELLNKVFIATPHIAGYSADGKSLATKMALQAVAEFYGRDVEFTITPPVVEGNLLMEIESENLHKAILQIYNPEIESIALKESPLKFEWFRGNYKLRREPSAYTIKLI